MASLKLSVTSWPICIFEIYWNLHLSSWNSHLLKFDSLTSSLVSVRQLRPTTAVIEIGSAITPFDSIRSIVSPNSHSLPLLVFIYLVESNTNNRWSDIFRGHRYMGEGSGPLHSIRIIVADCSILGRIIYQKATNTPNDVASHVKLHVNLVKL